MTSHPGLSRRPRRLQRCHAGDPRLAIRREWIPDCHVFNITVLSQAEDGLCWSQCAQHIFPICSLGDDEILRRLGRWPDWPRWLDDPWRFAFILWLRIAVIPERARHDSVRVDTSILQPLCSGFAQWLSRMDPCLNASEGASAYRI